MIVKRLVDIQGTSSEVIGPDWCSRRLLLRSDNVGYSFHDTIMTAGSNTTMRYTNHVEAVYCIEGEGEVINEETGERHLIQPGTLYLLDKHDQHTLIARTALRNICVFTPACTGNETHDETGSYPLPAAD
jgi:L-ectoine synthase